MATMRKLHTIIMALSTRRLSFAFDKMEITLDRVSWKRLANWAAAELSAILRTRRAWAYPTHLQIEPTSRCNLKCPLCNVVTDTGRSRGEMSLDRFRSIIDEIGDYLLFIQLWGFGEPFMNRDIFSMIQYAKSRGIKIITSTNGHFFEDQDNIDKLLNSGLDYLIFALDGADRETYEKYRSGGDFEKALNGLRFLMRRRTQAQVSLPLVNLRMVVSRDNEGQIPLMKSLAKEMGVDFFSLITMSPINSCESEWKKRIPVNPDYCRVRFDDSGGMIRKKLRCKRLWNHPFVYQDGNVYSCEYYTSRDQPLGNVFDGGGSAFKKIWLGKSFERLRVAFAGRAKDAKCADCPRNYGDAEQNVCHMFTPQSLDR
jgi:radical SAM protein with 4Fe4S-binding SPASM domain